MNLKKVNPNIIFAVLFNVFIFFVFLFLFSPRLETNDDYYLGNIVSGAYGLSSTYMAYVNIVLGSLLSIFYSLVNTLNWWVIGQYFLILVSMILLTYLFSEYLNKWLGRAVGMIISICFGYELYVSLQYSKTAGFITMVAFLILFCYARLKLKIYWGIAGVALALLASYIRIESFCFILPFVAFIWLVDVIKKVKNIRKEQILKYYILPFSLLFILVITSYLFNQYKYDSNEEWKYWNTYNEARTGLLDYGFPDYKSNELTYKELGISKEDLVNYNILWNFDDPDKFSLDTIEKLISLKEKQKISITLIIKSVKTSIITLDNKIVYICVILIALLLLMSSKKVKWLNVLMGIAIFELLFFYLYYVGRYYAYRINILLWMGLLLIILLSINKEVMDIERISYRKVAIFASLGLLLWIGNLNYRDSTIVKNHTKGNNARNLINFIEKDKENLYIVDCLTFSGTEYLVAPILKSVPFAKEENIYYLGGWLTNSPVWKSIKHKYDFENPWKKLYESPDVYLIDNIDIEGKLRYLHDYYDENLKYSLIKDIYNYKIYRIHQDISLEESNINDGNQKCEFSELTVSESELKGWAYLKGDKAYNQQIYIKLINTDTNQTSYYYATQVEDSNSPEIYSGYNFNLQNNKIVPGNYNITIILENGGRLYRLNSTNLKYGGSN